MRWLAVAVVLIASSRIVATYKVLSHTTDEPAHLAAGMEWIERGAYTYEDQHPPLARVTGALGAYWVGVRAAGEKDIYQEGYRLLAEGGRYWRTLFYSRLFMLPFFWVAAATVYLWGRRLGGERVALLSTLLFTTTPPVLAHAGLVTTDMALTAFVGAASLASLYWAEAPGFWRSVAFGGLVGLAVLSKFSSLVFLPAVWILMCGVSLRRGGRRFRRDLLPWGAVATGVAGLLVCIAYRFNLAVFFSGIRHVARHNAVGHLAYLLGRRSQFGFWYYYPVVLAVKTPLALLALMSAALRWRRELAMPLALIAGVLGVALFSHINIGVRHILPVYIGFAVCGGFVLARIRLAWVLALVVWQIASGAVVHPDYLAYTNELAGRHPERILADSDLDWNQGMRGLALRLRELGVRDLTFKLSSGSYMTASGDAFPQYRLMPDGDRPNPGWNAVSVTEWKITGEPKWAEHAEPLERVRRSIYLYYFPLSPAPSPAAPSVPLR